MSDQQYMAMALDLASAGIRTSTPNPRVGCIVVSDGKVIGSGWHVRAGEDHAEVVALREADSSIRGATVYVNLEPCSHHGQTPPCVDALVQSMPAKVVVAMEDPNPQVAGQGIAALREAGIECEVGVLEDEARWLNRGFVRRMLDGLPWVILKTASAMDGRIALPNGDSRWITSEAGRKDVHELRASCCAILTGSGTALIDDPMLTARDVGAERQPLRVLVDGKGACPPSLRLFEGGDVVVATAGPAVQDYASETTHLEFPAADGKVDLEALLRELARRWQINYLLVEGGAGLGGSLISLGLVDEVVAYLAPRYLGSGTAVTDFAGIDSLDATPFFSLREMRQVGPDCRLTLVRSS